jgi:hypothetical protein
MYYAWFTFVTLLARALGIRAPFIWPGGIGRKKLTPEFRQLSRRQYIIFEGVIRYGLGVPLLVTVADYISFRLGIRGPIDLSQLVLMFLIFVPVGIYVGFKGWNDLLT